jgi:hypothetical protein
MVKTVLFVNNHIKGLPEVQEICSKENLLCGGTLISEETPIVDGYSYAISPCEAGFDFTISLFNKFDNVIFLKNHDNFPLVIMQKELEIIYNRSYRIKFPRLHQNKINFFGSSETAGIGHEHESTTYPAVLSKLLGLEYNNYGLPGRGPGGLPLPGPARSNYDIEDLLNTYTIENSKLVIQLTDIYRIRYFFNDTLVQTPIHRAEKYVQNAILAGEENLFFNFKKLVERIVNRLREGNNQFLLTFGHNIDSDYSIKCLEFLIEFEEFRSMQGCAVDLATDNLHLGIISHTLWAKQLYRRWTELYV